MTFLMSINTFGYYQTGNQDSLIISYKTKISNSKSLSEKADSYFLLAKIYSKKNKADIAYENYTNALTIYTNLNLYEKIMECNFSIFKLLDSQKNIKANALFYLKSYSNFAKERNDTIKFIKANLGYASYYFNDEGYIKAKAYYKKTLVLSKKIKDTLTQAKINSNLGLLYSSYFSQDSAKIYFEKSLTLFKPENKIELFSTYLNYANLYQKEKKYKLAILQLKKAEQIPIVKYKDVLYKNLYKKIASCYEKINDFSNAYLYIKKYNIVKDSINLSNQNIAISKFDNEKLRADNLVSEVKITKNRNYLIAALLTLFFGGITAILIQKSTRRKQKLAEKEKALETQKLATVLKEQELMSIDAMIEGQEKERQRIANDLHDDLGGLMANVKLHFNSLKETKSTDLYNKTNLLLDEAYQKIRSIAHAKNSGVIAKQGLLKAVNEMAIKISALNKIQIVVLDHGLENRLENSLELTIFRVIQELITNIIKHAKACQVTIHLTNHEESLNIMVEDNGIGFNTKNISSKNGMGIQSIDKRIEYLEGTMTIESEINQGTTIIIDIPL